MSSVSVDMTIKVANMPEVTELDGEKVMIDFDSGKYFMIKGVGNDIWEMIADDVKVSDIVEKLLSEYEVEREVCEKEVESFIRQLEEYKFIKLV
jgi:hypothetical protein